MIVKPPDFTASLNPKVRTTLLVSSIESGSEGIIRVWNEWTSKKLNKRNRKLS